MFVSAISYFVHGTTILMVADERSPREIIKESITISLPSASRDSRKVFGICKLKA